MLESDDFEAVVIATPDHWHAKAAIMAMQAGKHVYLEKPTSHNPAENEMLVQGDALKYNRIVQVGNQRRSVAQRNQSNGRDKVRINRESKICQILVCQQPPFHRHRESGSCTRLSGLGFMARPCPTGCPDFKDNYRPL